MAQFEDGALHHPLVAATGTTPGAVCAIANPEGRDLYVTRCIANISTDASGAATVDFGIAANAATSSDILMDGLDVGTAAGVFDNIKNPGTNGKAGQKWGATEFLTGTASATLAGMVGELIVEYLPL